MSTSEKPSAAPGEEQRPKSATRLRLERLMAEYGAVAIVTYLVIFASTWAGFALLIGLGWSVEGSAAGAGVLFAAWVATKATQLVRIGATVVLTPIVARAWHRIRPPETRVLASDEGRAAIDAGADVGSKQPDLSDS